MNAGHDWDGGCRRADSKGDAPAFVIEKLQALADAVHDVGGKVEGVASSMGKYMDDMEPREHRNQHGFIASIMTNFATMKRGFFQLAGAATLIALGVGASKYFTGVG